ncbi:MAG: PAS domain S-box protein [Spirochaetales bacterium]|nr:PAS domain S-box protein [Spirochaetales bacterium]MCF7939801.1 PAS domain S-box protein [Spirochaetales bacterium]
MEELDTGSSPALSLTGEAKQKTLLLVEDEGLIALREASMLENHGYRVRVASSASKAIKAAKQNPPDLILMDIDLGKGKMRGTEAAKIILEHLDLPIIFLTGHTEKEMVQTVKGISSYGYVIKNSGEFVLIESIEMAFRLFETKRSLERKEIEAREIVENIDLAIIQYTPEGKIIYFSRGAEKLFGFSAEEMIGTNGVGKIIPETDSLGNDQSSFLDDIFRNLDAFHRHENENCCKDGSRLYVSWTNTAAFDARGNPLFLQSIGSDITAEKERQVELQIKNRAIETSFNAIAIADLDGTVNYVNSSFLRMWGYKAKSEVIKKPALSFWNEPEKAEEVMQDLFNGRSSVSELVGRRKDGSTFNVQVYPSFVPDENGRPMQIMNSFLDITERKQKEKQLRKALEEKDFFMTELNHRVKNNLAMISSLINLKAASAGKSADLSDIKFQIDAIRIVHDKLNDCNVVSEIKFKDYIQEILAGVFSHYPQPVTIENSLPEITLPTKTAIALGLITNEIATNAVKYGFRAGEQAVFQVELERSQESGPRSWRYTLSNTGNPFPESIAPETTETLGLRLINALVHQLEGEFELRREPFPVFTIRFQETPGHTRPGNSSPQ